MYVPPAIFGGFEIQTTRRKETRKQTTIIILKPY
jgi:hypothetical protein